MTTASLLHFCPDSLPGPPNDQWSSQQGESCHFRGSLVSKDEVWKISNWTDKIQHSPFCTETSVLGLANSASYSQVVLMNFRDEHPRTEILLLCCFCLFVCFECVLDWESQSRDLGTPGSEVPRVTGHDFWWWLCQSVLSRLGGGNSICWCPGSHLLIWPRGYCELGNPRDLIKKF